MIIEVTIAYLLGFVTPFLIAVWVYPPGDMCRHNCWKEYCLVCEKESE